MFVSGLAAELAELAERAAEGALMEQAVELAAERAVELLAVGLAAFAETYRIRYRIGRPSY